MKQIIIMAAMVVLGVAIFRLVAGSDQNTIISVMKGVWENEVVIRTSFP